MKLALLGDIALIGRYDRLKADDIDRRIQCVKVIVQDCDYVIANLESPLTQIKKTLVCKGVYLRSDPINVSTLKKMGVTHVTLANNHIFDYGKQGAVDTIKTLKAAGIKFVGLGNKPELLRMGNTRVLLDGFCCLSANGVYYGLKPGKTKLMTPDSLERFLKLASQKNCVPIASIHYGVEGVHYPSVEHIRLFREMAEKYNYILHGNHPHAIQGYEKYNDSLLVYAQGKLCFDETPVTSMHLVPREKEEERKCYISIVEVFHGRIKDYKTYTIRDSKESGLVEDRLIGEELKEYKKVLGKSLEELKRKRREELDVQTRNAEKRTIRFYINRMNYKYVGAYLNGRLHARKYNKIIKKYYETESKCRKQLEADDGTRNNQWM